MTRKTEDIQFQFLKILCDLYDGKDYVHEDKIRELWPKCPSHYEILELGVGEYFERNPDYLIHAYMPTGKGRAALHEWECSEQAAGELQKLRQDFDQYRAEEAANQAAQEHRIQIYVPNTRMQMQEYSFRSGAIIVFVFFMMFSFQAEASPSK